MTTLAEFDSTNCRTCAADIVWCTTEKGRKMPVDAAASADGNIRVIGTHRDEQDRPTPRIRVARDDEAAAALFDDAPRYLSHFTTCPNAKAWRR